MSWKKTSKIFDKGAFRAAISRDVMLSARVFRTATVDRMTESNPQGRIDNYENDSRRARGVTRGSSNFTRGFRRSAPGQRPAVETSTLRNAISATRISEFVARVDIADRINPRNGKSAKDYGEILQTKLNRPIMNRDDIRIAEIEFNYRLSKTVQSLL